MLHLYYLFIYIFIYNNTNQILFFLMVFYFKYISYHIKSNHTHYIEFIILKLVLYILASIYIYLNYICVILINIIQYIPLYYYYYYKNKYNYFLFPNPFVVDDVDFVFLNIFSF
jgi:hypothetical protein